MTVDGQLDVRWLTLIEAFEISDVNDVELQRRLILPNKQLHA